MSGGGTVLTISLQPGIKFTDGTPFNAAAVAWNIKRDLATPSTASPVSSWPPLAKASGVTTPDSLTVVLHFSAPYAPLITSLIGSNINHIASPTAVQKMGAKQFQKTPVGAGPFEVETNLVDHQLTLKKNPGYFQKGRRTWTSWSSPRSATTRRPWSPCSRARGRRLRSRRRS